jgi:glycosyltransferase involved in cell wall biosynthesis
VKRSRSSHKKRALLVYLTEPFVQRPDASLFRRHQNYTQVLHIASILDEHGFVVDALDFRSTSSIQTSKYDLIISINHERPPFELERSQKLLYLASGLHHKIHNQNLRQRTIEVQQTKPGIKLRQLAREDFAFVDASDAIACFGNEYMRRVWQEKTGKTVYPFNNTGFDSMLACNCLDSPPTGFLFLASGSQIRKGLDLLLSAFKQFPSFHLYVCSDFMVETDFVKAFGHDLFAFHNIHPVGHVNVFAEKFQKVLERCAFNILPSCSEGQPGSVVCTMGYGLIPVVSDECGLDTEGYGIRIAGPTLEDVRNSLQNVARMELFEIRDLQRRTMEFYSRSHTLDSFDDSWRKILTKLLDTSNDRMA